MYKGGINMKKYDVIISGWDGTYPETVIGTLDDVISMVRKDYGYDIDELSEESPGLWMWCSAMGDGVNVEEVM
jgi:hypothetical protein